MSMYYRPGEYEEMYAERYAEMKAHGVTDQEAEVITRLGLAPRGQNVLAEEMNITAKQVYDIYRTGAEKYLANGGKEYWQN